MTPHAFAQNAENAHDLLTFLKARPRQFIAHLMRLHRLDEDRLPAV